MTHRYLVLVRHAKAEHPAGVADVDRPLTRRGHADAAAAGAWLAHRGLAPQLVLCSPARRTRQTWHGLALGMAESAEAASAEVVGGGADVRYDQALYTGDAQDLLDRLREVDEETGIVLVVGHNPAISLFSAALDPAAEPGGEGLRTCGIAVHRPTGTWRESGSGTAVLTAAHTARG